MQKITDKQTTMALAEEIYKAAKMGGESITDILPRIKDEKRSDEAEKLRRELTKQFSEYEKIAADAEAHLVKENVNAKEENVMAKLSAKAGIYMKTMIDPSVTNVSEMMVQGLAMGRTDITSKMRIAKDRGCDEKVLDLADRLISFQEDAVDKIKAFL